MLTYDQIITLSDKGFTPQQIMTLTGEDISEPVLGPAQEENLEQESENSTTLPPVPEGNQEQNQDTGSLLSVLQDAIKGFSAEMAEMKKALQASNIRNIIREDIPPSETADNILAEIIHPTMTKEVNKK